MTKKRLVHIELVLVTVLTLVPWPGSLPPRPPCPRERAALVRKVLEKRWVPILDRVGAPLPLECPLHPLRDLFAEQEAHKRRREPQWLCAYCGKAFSHEAHLDRHLETRHGDHLNEREDSVCLADYCDVMRCEVLLQRAVPNLLDPAPPATQPHTALDVWTQHPLARTYGGGSDQGGSERTVPRSVMRPPQWQPWRRPPPATPTPSPVEPPTPLPPAEGDAGDSEKPCDGSGCRGSDDGTQSGSPSGEAHAGGGEGGSGGADNDADTSTTGGGQRPGTLRGPQELPLHPLHSWRDTCNEEHLSELRAKCQMLIQHCIAGLVLNLTLEQVRDVEAALQRSVCWYLTCERYWEAGGVDAMLFPWWLAAGAVLLLTLGVSMAYYLVWGLSESQEAATSPTSTDTSGTTYLTSHSPYPNYLTAPNPPTGQAGTSAHYLSHGGGSQVGHGSHGHHYLGTGGHHSQSSPVPGYSSYSVMSGSSRRRKLWAASNEAESECRDSGFNEGPLGGDLSNEEAGLQSYEPMSSGGPRSRHYSADSRPSSSTGGAVIPPDDSGRIEDRQFNYASSFTPNYEQRRLRRNRYNYLDDFDSYSEMEADQLDSSSLSRERSDSFIYVAYPPEIKKRFQQEQR